MFWLAARGLLSRRAAALLAGAGLLTATLGFIVLATTSKTAEAVLSGNIGRAWNSPYDLLVRPTGSLTSLERTHGLIRPNFISGINGGITRSQLAAIRAISGVQVAAPIAVVGFVSWDVADLRIDTSELQPGSPLTIYRVTVSATAQAGMSRYPIEVRYLAVATEGTFAPSITGGQLSVDGHNIDCSYPVTCYAPSICPRVQCQPATAPPYELPISQPIVIAGIDPKAEAALAHLDSCVLSGRYLRADDEITMSPAGPTAPTLPVLPVLASSQSFVDETFTLDVAQAGDAASVLTGTSPQQLVVWQPLLSRSMAVNDLYAAHLPLVDGSLDTWPVWTSSDVVYQQAGPGVLSAETSAPNLNIYKRNLLVRGPINAQVLIPPEARDRAFRSVTEHAIGGNPGSLDPGTRRWHLVGTYDPRCVPGFNPLAGGALETYAPPMVRLADGRLLGPTRSVADYVSSPPLLLTNLDGAAWLSDPTRFPGQPGEAFISAIRIRVRGVETPGSVSQARLSRVAADIHDQTGLLVDIVKGSSPQTIQVDLPQGNFGRPALRVREGWAVKGVAYRFGKAVTAQDLGLFGLVLCGALILAGQTTYTAVRRRQTEFGVLRALGWPASRIAWLVELEMLLLGLSVGLVAVAAGLLLSWGFRLQASVWPFIAAVPLALLVAGLGAILPAAAAGRGTTLRVMVRSGRVRRSRPPGSALMLGLRELIGPWKAEAILGILAIALGAALLGGVLLVALAFRGQLDTTVLGVYLAARVRPFHVALAGLALAIGALAAGEIITLSYLERQPQLAALRALGWPRSQVLQVLMTQALGLGVAGGLVASVVIGAVGWLVNAPLSAVTFSAAASCLVALLATVLAVVGPLSHAYRLPAADALRGE